MDYICKNIFYVIDVSITAEIQYFTHNGSRVLFVQKILYMDPPTTVPNPTNILAKVGFSTPLYLRSLTKFARGQGLDDRQKCGLLGILGGTLLLLIIIIAAVAASTASWKNHHR